MYLLAKSTVIFSDLEAEQLEMEILGAEMAARQAREMQRPSITSGQVQSYIRQRSLILVTNLVISCV